MSKEEVSTILARVLRDRVFAAELRADPQAVLSAFDLSDAERATIVAGLGSSGGGATLDQRPRLAGRIV